MFEPQLRAGPLFPAVAAGARHSIIGVHGWTYMKGSFTDRETEAWEGYTFLTLLAHDLITFSVTVSVKSCACVLSEEPGLSSLSL